MSFVRRAVVALASTLTLTAVSVGLAPSAFAVAPAICNHWTGNLGVIHHADGQYTNGTYDVLLYPGKCTDEFPILWSSAAGYSIGAGYFSYWYPEGRTDLAVRREASPTPILVNASTGRVGVEVGKY